MTLSRRQIKACDRFTGALLYIPWPQGLSRPERAGPERDASKAERHAVDLIIGEDCRANHLVILRVTVIWPQKRPTQFPTPAPFLLAHVLHQRWPRHLDNPNVADNPRPIWLGVPQ